ncbi:MAG: hypothetical protein FWF12_01350 [Betaproteobacteria bacterium]|nr:hypothetical protein [Betaproteobacteria bacterium]
MKKILLSILLGIAIFFLLMSFPIQERSPHALPWEIELDETGHTRVFGLSPGADTLNDVIARFGGDMELAIIVAANIPRGEEAKDAALEGYFHQVTLGFVHARLIITLDAPPSMIASMLERSIKKEYLRNGSRKFILHPNDTRLAGTLPLVALTLIPSAQLDAETIVSRFGTPAAIIPMGETLQHYLYPDKGLDVVLDSKGKEILQYVAPANFEQRIMHRLKPENVKPEQ